MYRHKKCYKIIDFCTEGILASSDSGVAIEQSCHCMNTRNVHHRCINHLNCLHEQCEGSQYLDEPLLKVLPEISTCAEAYIAMVVLSWLASYNTLAWSLPSLAILPAKLFVWGQQKALCV